jgi:lipopolysaccharide export system permease protein
VALLSLGYSYSKLIKPVIVAIISIIALHISSNFSDLAYSKQKSELILKGEFFESFRDDLLLKHNNSYIYFKRFYPINKRAEEVKIFTIENRDLSSIVVAKEATFDGDSWILKDALVVDKPTDLTQNDVKLEQKRLESFKFLEGFRPKIIDSVYHIKANFSITDALYAIKLLQSQNINTQRIQAILVSTFLMPFFSLFMVIILFYVGPIFKRYSNLVLFSSLSIFFTLLFWGLLFTLSKLIISSAMPIEFLILFIAGFATVAFVLYIRRD